MSTINWADLQKTAEDATKVLPEGEYPVEITKAEKKTASTGADMISVKMKVTDGQFTGRVLFNNFVLSPDSGFALAMWFRGLKAFGLDSNYFATGPEIQDIAATLVGRRAVANVGQKIFRGEQRNEILGLQAATGVPQPPIVKSVAAGVPGGMAVPNPIGGVNSARTPISVVPTVVGAPDVKVPEPREVAF